MEEIIKRLVGCLSKRDNFETTAGRDTPAELRDDLAEFYKLANPVDVSIHWLLGDLIVPGFERLEKTQIGYAVNPNDNSPLEGWPKEQTVIATTSHDPIFTTLYEKSPIFFATHGVGTWTGQEVAASFGEFLLLVAIWKEFERTREGKIYDDDFELLPEVISDFRNMAQKEGLGSEGVEVLLANR